MVSSWKISTSVSARSVACSIFVAMVTSSQKLVPVHAFKNFNDYGSVWMKRTRMVLFLLLLC